MPKLTLLAAASLAAGMALAGAANAASDFTVQATTPIDSWQDVGSYFTAGTTYDFTVINPATIWHAGDDNPYSRASNANGIDPVASGYGQYTFDGFTANYGALVGENGGSFFLIGTGSSFNNLSGDVKVGYWDSYYGDNSGTQELQISVPEPAAWALMLVGFAGLGAALRRRTTVAEAA